MLSLSQIIKNLQADVEDLKLNGGGSGGGGGVVDIRLGSTTYGDNASVNVRKGTDNIVYLDFVLPTPVTDARQFGVVVAASTLHHVIDRLALPAVATNKLTLTEKPNSCPVIITINGFSYVEASDVFTVDRTTKTVTWNADVAGFDLNSELTSEVFIGYEVSQTVTRMNETITISSIAGNQFNLSNTPNNTKIVIIINGVVYFEEQGDFTVNRNLKRVTWNSERVGFDIDSTLSGYLTVSYEIDV